MKYICHQTNDITIQILRSEKLSPLTKTVAKKQNPLTRQLFSDRPSKRLPSSSQLYCRSFSSLSEGNFNEEGNDAEPTSGISRPLSDVLSELNRKVPDALLRQRIKNDFSLKYIPWHTINMMMNLHAPEWSGEVRSITYSPDGKSISVVYWVTIHATDAEIFCESTGTAAVNSSSYGDPVQKAEAMAFR